METIVQPTPKNYDGLERPVDIEVSSLPLLNSFFGVRPPGLPADAQPIFDETIGACIGYSWEGSKGVWHIYDAEGQRVGIEESPLERSTFGPEDFILIGVLGFKILRSGWTAAASLAKKSPEVLRIGALTTKSIVATLRSRILSPGAKQLKFTEKTAMHMANPGRFVPVHILHLAIKFGKRLPDPQAVAGAFRYEIPMFRFVKRGTT
ncbi:hypothetical protein LJR129_002029 [Acidovorax sp. LjRoot129]|uniref:hypothetical protein n=1 Tax=Acidovorax sp. LjRoot129 TaxID=3342260 RepID=UPI003ED02109